MKRLRLAFGLLGLLALFGPLRARATHIVGGEFGLSYVSPGRYQLQLTLYFDAINGNPAAIDNRIECDIFRKGASFPEGRIESVVMDLQDDDVFVKYTNAACATAPGAVRTRVLTYKRVISLDTLVYTNPDGYYVVWERCCRNGTIRNIQVPGETGQTFYLEFPPLVKGDTAKPFINSSPTLFKPLSDFACINKLFYFDFSGKDVDGDSLAYSIAPPFAGNTTRNNPGGPPPTPTPNLPGPYPLVKWQFPYSDTYQIDGDPPINIDDRTGFLTMRPLTQGLFVFAIECREYRKGVYLGKVRREFQVFIQDCEPNTPPKLTLNPTGKRRLVTGDTLTLNFKDSTCQNLVIGDSLVDDEFISAFAPALPLGSFRFSPTSGSTRFGPFKTKLCFDPCFAKSETRISPLILRVRDNACSIPNKDSLALFVKIIAPQPNLGLLPLKGYQASELVITKSAGDISVQILAADSNFPVQFKAFTVPSFPGAVTVTPVSGTNRRRVFNASVTIPCELDSTQPYTLYLVAASGVCNMAKDTLAMPFSIKRKPSTSSLVLQDSTSAALKDSAHIWLLPGQFLDITGVGNVSDTGFVTVSAQSGFAPLASALGSATGQAPKSYKVRWKATCAQLLGIAPDSTFKLTYSATPQGCNSGASERLTVFVHIRDINQDSVRLTNIITLNGDSLNDAFKLYPPLPVPNCVGGFEGVEIYSRWGRKVYSSDDLYFSWKPEDNRPALYFYRLRFRGRAYKGWIEAVGE